MADDVLEQGECEDPSDLSKLADVVHEKTGSQTELVQRFPLAQFENAAPNRGYLIAAALMREHAIRDVLTLNFDLAIRHALASVGAGAEVGVITAPSDAGSAGVVNVVHLHRDVHAQPDDWILRTEQIEEAWRDGWEELVATRVMTAPVVVFAGLGTAAAVLVETTQRIRAAIEDHATFHVDPGEFGSSSFTGALAIREDRYVRSGWSEFMHALATRVVVEQLAVLRQTAIRLEERRDLQAENLDLVFDVCGGLDLLQLGELRARWLLRQDAYAAARSIDPLLIADLAQAAALLARELGVTFVAETDGCLQMRIGDRFSGALILASGGGTRDWPQFEAEVLGCRWVRARRSPDTTVVLAAGVTGNRRVASPDDLIDEPLLNDVAEAPVRTIFVDANELRADPLAALAEVR